MATRKLYFKTCDGCQKDEHFDGIKIVNSLNTEGSNKTFDLCSECVDLYYYCKLCNDAHHIDEYDKWIISKGVNPKDPEAVLNLEVKHSPLFQGNFCPEKASYS